MAREEAPGFRGNSPAGILAALMLIRLVWLGRVMPLRTWRSVLHTRKTLIVRLGLVVFAIAVGVLAVADPVSAVLSLVSTALLWSTAIVALIGRVTGN